MQAAVGRKRRSIRLQEYDYSAPGAYFVTIVCQDRAPRLGDVSGEIMALSPLGEIVRECWLWLGDHHPYVEVDAFVVMPNHIHGIIVLNDRRGGSRTAPTTPRKPLGRLIGAFKTASTKRINIVRETPGQQFWQRNYYERVIRDDRELNAIREYIENNPRAWPDDPENIERSVPESRMVGVQSP